MDTIKVSVRIPLAAAVARGVSSYGNTLVALSDTDLASLSEGARAVLVEYAQLGRSLDVEVADVPYALAALEAEARVKAEEKVKEQAASEAKIQEVLAIPDAQWISSRRESDHYCLVRDEKGERVSDSGYTYYAPCVQLPGTVYLTDAQKKDPRLTERIAAIAARDLPGLRAAFEARMVEYRAFVAARDAKRAEDKAAIDRTLALYHACVRELAAEEDDFARAVKEGYSVERRFLDGLADRLAKRGTFDGQKINYAIDSEVWGDLPDRSAPDKSAFALLDHVTHAVREANERLPVSIGQWVVSRIVRVDVCPHSHHKNFVTAVLATLSTPTTVRQITWSTESLVCTHDVYDDNL